jgi:hypothetical protein
MKLLVLVRKDISSEQRAVQATHAVAEYLLQHRETPWANGTVVLLGVDDESSLQGWKQLIDQAGVSSSMFYEPDIDSHTALAFVHNKEDRVHKKLKRRLDSKLKLLSMN